MDSQPFSWIALRELQVAMNIQQQAIIEIISALKVGVCIVPAHLKSITRIILWALGNLYHRFVVDFKLARMIPPGILCRYTFKGVEAIKALIVFHSLPLHRVYGGENTIGAYCVIFP